MMTTADMPQLSLPLVIFSADDPGGWESLWNWAVAVEQAGVDRVVVSDHVAFGERLDAYGDPTAGGKIGGTQPTGPDGHWLEPLSVLSYLAAITTRVRLGTNILIAALRRPVVLAKQLATLDVISQGRIDLGVGVGWQREEYEAAGLAFEQRGDLLDHTLRVCSALWRYRRCDYDDGLLSFARIHQMPKPIQGDGVPIWVSGALNKRVVARLAAYGSGWIPWGPAAADLATHIPLMKRALAEAGRDDADALQVVGELPVARAESGRVDLRLMRLGMERLVGSGVTDVRLGLLPSGNSAADEDDLRAVSAAFRASYRS
jgi:probable F420-dependent oxidoreductase